MTETQTAPNPADDPKILALVKKSMDGVIEGKISLSDLISTVTGDGALPVVDKKPPVPKALTDDQLEAIKRLPEVYGKIVVTADRALKPAEQRALVEERKVVDTVLTVLKTRKEESLREVFANHCDNVLTDEEKAEARTDSKGHYAVKQDLPVEGTGQKIQRSVSGGKPRLDISHIEALHEEGHIDRATYLKITKKPDVPRVMDESGLHRAIQKDPRLFFLLASAAEPTTPTTTIKVVKDS
jgi:hypothetical protein